MAEKEQLHESQKNENASQVQQIQAKQAEIKKLNQKIEDLEDDLAKSNEEMVTYRQNLAQSEALFKATQIKLGERSMEVRML